ncbi:MAG: hypothetical protein NVS3B21_19060 [Acidimicrobiales bacterium]
MIAAPKGWPLASRRGVALFLLAVMAIAGLAGCGGGRGRRTVALAGQRIPVSQLRSQFSALCSLGRRAHDDPSSANAAYYGGGPHDALHLLASGLDTGHQAEGRALSDALVAFERDIGAAPPPRSTPDDVDRLVMRAASGLRVVGVSPPACGTLSR